MSKLLHINSSVRNEGSISRKLTGEFIAKWKDAHPSDEVVERDLAAQPIPHLNEKMMGAFFTPAEKRSAEQAETVKISDELVQELLAADVVVIGAPMYNFSIASSLKAWIDHVARAGITFKYTQEGPVGLVKNKKVYVFISRDGIYTEGPAKSMEFQDTYLRTVLGFLGMDNITFIHTEGLAMGKEIAERALSQTRQKIAELV